MKRYERVQLLQKRRFSQIWEILDGKTGRLYIGKEVSRTADPRIIRAFQMEAEVLSTLHNPHIPELIDIQESTDSMMIIESRLKGIDLDQWLKKAPSLKKRLEAAFQLGALLQELHSHGYLYTDLKADNILIEESEVFLIDFNACLYNAQHQSPLATIACAAPELFGSGIKSEKVDVYGFGGVLKKLLPERRYARLIQACLLPEDRRLPDIESVLHRIRRTGTQMRTGFYLMILSVFTIPLLLWFNPFAAPSDYTHTGSPLYLVSEFQQRQADGASGQSILYQWIEADLLEPEDLAYPGVASFLALQAVQTRNATLAACIQQRLPEDFARTQPQLAMLLDAQASSRKPDPEGLQAYLDQLDEQSDPLLGLETLLIYCTQKQTALNPESLQAWCRKLYEPSLASSILQYLLMCQAQQLPLFQPEAAWLEDGDADLAALWKQIS